MMRRDNETITQRDAFENCQAGAFAVYLTPDGGRALIDRELYLPEKWTADRDRCRAAGISDETGFATKSQRPGIRQPGGATRT
jgi:hypothetical protein